MTGSNAALARFYVTVSVFSLMFLVACDDGGPNSEGNNDTLFTGLSGLVVVALVLWLLWRVMRRRGPRDGPRG